MLKLQISRPVCASASACVGVRLCVCLHTFVCIPMCLSVSLCCWAVTVLGWCGCMHVCVSDYVFTCVHVWLHSCANVHVLLLVSVCVCVGVAKCFLFLFSSRESIPWFLSVPRGRTRPPHMSRYLCVYTISYS